MDYIEVIAASLTGWAVLALASGHPTRAARLCSAAGVVHRAPTVGLFSLEFGALHERTVDGARAHLGEARFTGAWAEGQALTLEQAVAEALDTLGDEAGTAAAATGKPRAGGRARDRRRA